MTVIPGFEHVHRYWDAQRQEFITKVKPGEYFISNQDEPITTTLGSCIAACIRDPQAGVGGLNHFMLPAGQDSRWGSSSVANSARYGNFAMEHLINAVLSQGGRRRNLEVKIFGGAAVLQTETNIGLENVKFVKSYLAKEGYQLVGEDVGGTLPRKLVYFPLSGRAMVKHLQMNNPDLDRLIKDEQTHMVSLKSPSKMMGEIELF